MADGRMPSGVLLIALLLCGASAFRAPVSGRARRAEPPAAVRESLERMVVEEEVAREDGTVCTEHTWRQDALEKRLGSLWKGSHATAPLHSAEVLPPAGAAEEAAPVIILHGLLGSSRNFVSWAQQLSESLEKPRKMYLVDLRNHGDSPHMPKMDYISQAADVVRFMQHRGIERASVIGHSMGGKVASAVALLFPEKVEALGVLDIAPVPYEAEGGTSGVWKEVNTLLNALRDMPAARPPSSSAGSSVSADGPLLEDKKSADAWLRDQGGVDDEALRAFALTNLAVDRAEKRVVWRIGIDTIFASLGVLGGFDIGQGITEDASSLGLAYPGDAFFVAGSRSRFIRSSHLQEIAALFPRYKLASIKNAGHWVHAEDPQASQDMVRAFLDR